MSDQLQAFFNQRPHLRRECQRANRMDLLDKRAIGAKLVNHRLHRCRIIEHCQHRRIVAHVSVAINVQGMNFQQPMQHFRDRMGGLRQVFGVRRYSHAAAALEVQIASGHLLCVNRMCDLSGVRPVWQLQRNTHHGSQHNVTGDISMRYDVRTEFIRTLWIVAQGDALTPHGGLWIIHCKRSKRLVDQGHPCCPFKLNQYL